MGALDRLHPALPQPEFPFRTAPLGHESLEPALSRCRHALRRARCFIKCLLMRLKNPQVLDPVLSLTAANLPRCLEGARAFRERIPGLFAPGFGDDAAAKVLGALNTNSHEVGAGGLAKAGAETLGRDVWRPWACFRVGGGSGGGRFLVGSSSSMQGDGSCEASPEQSSGATMEGMV